jgi:cytosine/adenosine deaminase-related metal-dependent hydrolase
VKRLVVKGEWVIRASGGRQVPVRDHAVVIEAGRIADVTAAPPMDAEVIDIPGAIVCPGLLNLHNHTINAPVFRGIVDDLPRSAIGESKVYSMLMPIGSLAMTYLSDEELEAVVALGLLEVMKSGATTLLDQFRPRQQVILNLAKRWGLRFYGAPYLFSPARSVGDRQVADAAKGSVEGATGLEAFERLFAEFDEGPGGRIRVILGPHAADSCAPDLLIAVDHMARERNLLVTLHLAQSQGEVDRVRAERGLGPAAYMQSVGLLREGVLFAHGTHLTDDELPRLSGAGAAIANCASVFLRGGKSPTFERFRRHGVKTVIGTDAERMDMFSQLRSTGFASKQMFAASTAATAADMLHAATITGADVLRRPDLGRLEKGATADLIVIDAMKPHLQPVCDPIRTLVWYASAGDIDTVIIDGKPVVRGGRATSVDEAAIVTRGREATLRLWEESKRRGHFPVEAAPATI